MTRTLKFALVLVLSVAVPLACASDMEAPMSRSAKVSVAKPQAAGAASLEAEKADSDGRGGEAAAAGKKAAFTRKVIRNGEIYLVVKSYKPAREAIEGMVKKSGGYIANSSVEHSLNRVSSATLTVRVPSGHFQPVMAALARLGVVQSESTNSKDITEQYYDIKARLATAQKLEARLLELLQTRTNKVADLLQVERELARVREKVESFQGKLRLFDNLVDLSTLTIHLSIQQKYTPPKPPTLISEITDVLGDSWDSLKAFGRGALLACVALLPWVLPIGLVVYGLVRLVRRWRRRRRAG